MVYGERNYVTLVFGRFAVVKKSTEELRQDGFGSGKRWIVAISSGRGGPS